MLHWAMFSKLQSIKVNCLSLVYHSPLRQPSMVDIDYYYIESTLFQYTVNTGYNLLVYKILRNKGVKNKISIPQCRCIYYRMIQ